MKDCSYASTSKAQKLDLYLPRDSKDALPLIVFIHGGGWFEGDKRFSPAEFIASHGYACASINYRLSNEAIFPAQIYDCKAAVRWLRDNADKYNYDPNKIGVWGCSAGGHLAALMGTSCGVKALEGKEGSLRASSSVQAVCDWCGPTNLLTIEKQGEPGNILKIKERDGMIAKFLGGLPATKAKLAKQADPDTYVSSDNPPFLIMHGDHDDLVPIEQSRDFYKTLQAKHVNSRMITVKNGKHSFGNYESFAVALQFFNQALKSDPAARNPPVQHKKSRFIPLGANPGPKTPL